MHQQAEIERRRNAKDNRTARIDRSALVRMLLENFKQHRIWGLRDLKAVVQQPEVFIRETLSEIAFMHKHGDFNGKWELKEEYKAQDAELLNPHGSLEAPKQEDSEMDVSGMDDDDEDEDEKFVDV